MVQVAKEKEDAERRLAVREVEMRRTLLEREMELSHEKQRLAAIELEKDRAAQEQQRMLKVRVAVRCGGLRRRGSVGHRGGGCVCV
jgi:hypothetical protein